VRALSAFEEPEVVVTADVAGVASALLRELEAVVCSTLASEESTKTSISLALVSDAQMTELNRVYLSHDGPTDVISFPLELPGGGVVGDVYIGFDQARRQAEELGIAPREELLRLAIHGTLHVLGWDHPEDGDRAGSEMYRRQEEILAAYREA